MPKWTDLKNKRFTKLIVLDFHKIDKHGSYLWKCKCDCGNIRYIPSAKLNGGYHKTCGSCLDNYGAINSIFYNYKKRAKERNLNFNLDKEIFIKLIKSNCHYCNTSPINLRKLEKGQPYDFYYNGIDRKNNKLGYTLKNTVPCCGHCNIAKFKMNDKEFRNWIILVYKHYIGEIP